MDNFHRKNFVEMRRLMDARLAKDSAEVSTLFSMAKYFESAENISAHSLDSAYFYLRKSSEALKNLTAHQQKKLKGLHITPRFLAAYKKSIAQKSYRNLLENLEKPFADIKNSFQNFLNLYADDDIALPAKQKYDSLAYQEANFLASIGAYTAFLAAHPRAAQAVLARAQLARLVFEAFTQEGTAESYADFIEKYPESPYKPQAERLLFRRFMRTHSPEKYAEFIEKYPQNTHVSLSNELIYSISKHKNKFAGEADSTLFSSDFKADLAVSPQLYFPFFSGGKYGFMDSLGEVKILPAYPDLPTESRSALEGDFFLAYNKGKLGVVGKSGKALSAFRYGQIAHFSPGVFLVKTEDGFGLLHRSGFKMISCKYARLLPAAGKWVQFWDGKKWGILSYYGDTLLAPAYDDFLYGSGNMIAAAQEGTWQLLWPDAEGKSADHNEAERYQTCHFTPSDCWQLTSAAGTKILDANGNLLLNLEGGTLRESANGWIGEKQGRYILFDKAGNLQSKFSYEKVYADCGYYALKLGGKWALSDRYARPLTAFCYDTLYFSAGKAAIGAKNGRQFVYFYLTQKTIDCGEYEKILVKQIKYDGKVKHFLITKNKKGRYGVLTEDGIKIIENRYDDIKFMSDNLIFLRRFGLCGLVNERGEWRVPLRYAGIAKYAADFFALLQNKKFGIYRPDAQKIIPPEYDALPQKYALADSVLIAKKGKFGLISYENNPLTDFVFQALFAWNDTILLGKTGGQWRLYDFKNRRYSDRARFSHFTFVRNDRQEIVLKTFGQDGAIGLLSNRRGRLAAQVFSQIRNLGQAIRPFYELKKAGKTPKSYQLLYLNAAGDTIRSEQVVEK